MIIFKKYKVVNVITLSILLQLSSFCFSQKKQGVAIYKVKTSYAFKNIEKEGEKLILNKLFEDSGKESDISFKLIFKDNKSVFFADRALQRDNNKVDFVSVKAKILGKIFVNLDSEEVIQNKEKFGEIFNIKSSTKDHKWILTKETIKIGDFKCYKAELRGKRYKKNKTVAWYAPELNYHIGPLGYCGLPGLVILLKDDIFIYALKELKLNLSKQDLKIVEKPKTGIDVTKKEYDSIYKIMRERKDQLEMENYMGK